MSEALTKFELTEKDLELVVNEKTLGSLTTNAKQIKAMVEKALPNYDISNYDENNISVAKKDKAMLNTASKALNDRRIQFEKEFMQPFAEFKTVVGDTVTLIKECSGKIDTVVRQSEENEQKAKQKEIEAIWSKKDFDLVSLEKISNPKWMNKGASFKNIESEIDERIAGINDDIKTIEAIGEDVDLLKSLYIDTLNLNSTIQYARTLKENREKAKAEAEARAQAEAEKQAKVEAETPIVPRVQPIEEKVIETPQITFSEIAKPELYTRAFKVTTTRENIIELGNFMQENGIKFEKLEL